MSHAAMRQSGGNDVCRRTIPPIATPMTMVAAQTTDAAHAITSRRRRRDPRARRQIAVIAAAVNSARRSRPASPSGQATLAPGHDAETVATAPIHCAGSQAIHATASATGGAMDASRQATTPIPVAIGAAGPARRFASTP